MHDTLGMIAPVPTVATAGRRGADVRSDVHITIERTTGQPELELLVSSRVGSIYGEDIRTSVLHMLTAAGARNVRVTVEDQGGLPFVIAARVESALRRAGFLAADLRPERLYPVPPESERDHVRRSRLYLPGNEPRFMINAGLHRPDGIILDLEDSVPFEEKDAARLLVRNALRCIDFIAIQRVHGSTGLDIRAQERAAAAPRAS